MIRTVTHTASGASIQISSYGATLVSYQSGSREHLMVSQQALLDGSAPVRGGIPVVFPIFGPPTAKTSTMPQHGFARRNLWTEGAEYDTPESAGVSYQLELSHVTAGRGEGNIWSQSGVEQNKAYDCTLFLTVDFNGNQLTTTLTVRNTGSAAFPFQALLHSYYKVEGSAALQPDQCFVQGLEGYVCDDKVSRDPPYPQTSEPITIAGEVDRVFVPPEGQDVVHALIGVGGDKTVTMEASGQVDGLPVPISCVVWNPYVEKAAGLADFGNEEYHDMICVEPGILGNDVVLEPGKEAFLKQVIHV
jgi:glucose-6-phosphate 1-epimerase